MISIETCRKRLKESYGITLTRTRGKNAVWQLRRDSNGEIIDSDESFAVLIERIYQELEPIIEYDGLTGRNEYGGKISLFEP